MKRQIRDGFASVREGLRAKISKTAKAISKRKIFVKTYSGKNGPEIIVAYLEDDVPSRIAIGPLCGYAKGVMIFTNRGNESSMPKTGRIEDYDRIVKTLKLSVDSTDKLFKIERPYNDINLRADADFLRPLVLRFPELVSRYPGKLERRVTPQRITDKAA